ncbi:hypothetical protein [Nocardia sp. CA-135398]|uniref:hypothetical protein n=1 Tax=Nocardia sp. CA-135398 TaxID=3239977 RepID=UPI003D991579
MHDNPDLDAAIAEIKVKTSQLQAAIAKIRAAPVPRGKHASHEKLKASADGRALEYTNTVEPELVSDHGVVGWSVD